MSYSHSHLLKSPVATGQLSGELFPEITFERMPRFKQKNKISLVKLAQTYTAVLCYVLEIKGITRKSGRYEVL